MLKITAGNIDALKAEMKQRSTIKGDAIKQIKTSVRFSKLKGVPRADQLKIDQLEKEKVLLNPSKTLPVRVDNLVIDFKLYERFMKKIRDFSTVLTVNEDCILVTYEKGRTKGELVLKDLSHIFKDFISLPTAEMM